MNTFLKVSIIILLTVILTLLLPKNTKDYITVIAISSAVCIVIAISHFLAPIISMTRDLTEMANVDSSLLEILLKVTGVAILAEFVILICNDSGNTSLGKGMQMLSSVVILWLSLPLFTMLMDIIENVFTYT